MTSFNYGRAPELNTSVELVCQSPDTLALANYTSNILSVQTELFDPTEVVRLLFQGGKAADIVQNTVDPQHYRFNHCSESNDTANTTDEHLICQFWLPFILAPIRPTANCTTSTQLKAADSRNQPTVNSVLDPTGVK